MCVEKVDIWTNSVYRETATIHARTLITFVVQYYAISLKFNHLYGIIVKNRDFVKLQT